MATKTKKKASETPLMKQYYSIKKKHPETILLFRIGDFYETFENDAVVAAEVLGIVLTKRANGAASYVALAGFPHHSLQTYLPKLVKAGHRVAICEQLEDPKLTKNIVKRGVTELVTPGVSFNDNVLEQKSNNFLAALHFGKKNKHGIAFLDVSTGEFLLAEGEIEYIDKLVQSLSPKEILYQRSNKSKFNEFFSKDLYSFQLDDWAFSKDFAIETLTNHFNTTSLKGFGIHGLENGTIAAGAALQYLKDTRHDKVGHITSISRIQEDRFVWMDKFTMRNLELFYSPNSESTTLL